MYVCCAMLCYAMVWAKKGCTCRNHPPHRTRPVVCVRACVCETCQSGKNTSGRILKTRRDGLHLKIPPSNIPGIYFNSTPPPPLHPPIHRALSLSHSRSTTHTAIFPYWPKSIGPRRPHNVT